MNKKNYLVIGGICLLVILLVICFGLGEKDSSSKELSDDATVIMENAQKESASVAENEKKEFEQINVSRYLELYSANENTLVLLARPTCHYCQIAEPIIQNIAYKNNIDIKYLNTDNFEGDDIVNLRDSNEMFKEGFGTPLLLIVGNNEIKDKVDGLTDKAHYEEFFKVYGFMK